MYNKEELVKAKGAISLQKIEKSQLDVLQERFYTFMETLESIEPEKVDLAEIDHLIEMIDEIEEKFKELKDDDQ